MIVAKCYYVAKRTLDCESVKVTTTPGLIESGEKLIDRPPARRIGHRLVLGSRKSTFMSPSLHLSPGILRYLYGKTTTKHEAFDACSSILTEQMKL